VVCFDRAAPTFRKQMYAGYQAKRPTMSDDLGPQFGLLHKVLETAKIKVDEIDGYEADDLIGTLAEQAKKDKDLQVIILTGDRDLLQLVDKNVLIIAPITGVSNTKLFDEEAVKEKYGLEPHQLVDYKSLVGDPSDNYPGVSGIGPKTASDLVNRFHTLEGIYENLGEISPTVQMKLANDAEQAVMAKKLATIVRDAPVKLELEKSEMKNVDFKNMFLAFNDLGFRTLIARFSGFDKIQDLKSDKKPSSAKVSDGQKKSSEEQLGLL
jgi:DNA polymerase-1